MPTPRERIIFPLDTPDWERSRELVKRLHGHVGWFKIGLELFVNEGPEVVRRLREAAPEAKIFLDLKLHDIPATVTGAVEAAGRLNVDLITVHAQGGTAMMAAAVQAAGRAGILAVTLLTSLDPQYLPELTPERRAPGAWVELLAERALSAGCRGLVASGHEVARLRQAFGPEPLLVIPGIRPAWAQVGKDDQKRMAAPAEVIRAGADLLVIGRPIRLAADPAAAADRVAGELAGL